MEITVHNSSRDKPADEGGGPWLRPHRVFYGWGPIGLAAGLLFQHDSFLAIQPVLRAAALIAGGYAAAVLVGLLAESSTAWIARHRRQQRGTDPRTDRTDCHLVHITVNSYEFSDTIGKDFDPDAAFDDTPPAWPAHVTPSRFVFTAGEAFRDVVLHVDAPDEPAPARPFNVNVWQGGVPSGGATVTITTGGR